MDVQANVLLVAHCGLYCGECRTYKKGSCPGCRDNSKATWCKVRECCQTHGYDSCADCKEFADPSLCSKHNNMISKIIGFIFRSDRRAGIMRIKEIGREEFAREMAERGLQAIKKTWH